MLSKSFVAASILLLALTSPVDASASEGGSLIIPGFGVSSTPVSGDVQHPSGDSPCGTGIPITAENLAKSTSVQADFSGKFTLSIKNFGVSSSRLIQTAKVDQTATGNSFTDCQIVQNGDADPTAIDTQELIFKLPDNIKCAGGVDKKYCLAQFVTAAGDGNCVVITQSGNNGKRSPADKAKPKPKSSPEPTPPVKSHKKQPKNNAKRFAPEDTKIPKPEPEPSLKPPISVGIPKFGQPEPSPTLLTPVKSPKSKQPENGVKRSDPEDKDIPKPKPQPSSVPPIPVDSPKFKQPPPSPEPSIPANSPKSKQPGNDAKRSDPEDKDIPKPKPQPSSVPPIPVDSSKFKQPPPSPGPSIPANSPKFKQMGNDAKRSDREDKDIPKPKAQPSSVPPIPVDSSKFKQPPPSPEPSIPANSPKFKQLKNDAKRSADKGKPKPKPKPEPTAPVKSQKFKKGKGKRADKW